jgi:type IV pilus assembly protein PilA
MKKKGFTLIEILAVVAVMGILSTIVGVSVVKIKKKANIKEAKEMEKQITNLGEEILAHEKISVGKSSKFIQAYNDEENKYYINIEDLKNSNYLDSDIKNPAGGTNCTAYLVIEDKEFKGLIDCPNLYATGQTDNTYTTLNIDSTSMSRLFWNSNKWDY